MNSWVLVILLGIHIGTLVFLLLLYKDYVHFKYSYEAKKLIKRPKKEYLLPGRGGIFTVKSKRRAIINDDSKAYLNEVNDE